MSSKGQIRLPEIQAVDNQLRDKNWLNSNPGTSIAILGMVRSGKSVLLINLLAKKPKKGYEHASWWRCFDRCIIFSPSQNDPKWQKLLNTKFLKGGNKPHPSDCYDGYPGEEKFNEIIDDVEERSDEIKTVFVWDDCAGQFAKSPRYKNMAIRLAHLSSCSITCYHSFKTIPPQVRANISFWAIFGLSTENLRLLYGEIPVNFSNFRDMLSAAKFCWRNPDKFNFMWIQVKTMRAYSWGDQLCLTDL